MKMNEIIQQLTQYNRTIGNSRTIHYIVIHYVGATGGSAANAKYFGSRYVGASAHYFVGHKGEPIYQVVADKDIAWHCGTKGAYKHPTCRNTNSIGIEMCCWKGADGWYFDEETIVDAIALTKLLMAEYGIPVDRVLRHYDVTGKICPEPMVRDSAKWDAFRSALADSVQEPSEQPDISMPRGMVAKVQQTLNQVYGYHLSVDNSPGPDTRKHLIMALQTELNRQYNRGLTVDGSFGPATKAAVVYTRRGIVGNITWLVQAALYCKGYDPKGLDGSFGPGMQEAVIQFQKDHGLQVDGSAGPDTQASLFR